jgi:hypothetical protein
MQRRRRRLQLVCVFGELENASPLAPRDINIALLLLLLLFVVVVVYLQLMWTQTCALELLLRSMLLLLAQLECGCLIFNGGKNFESGSCR